MFPDFREQELSKDLTLIMTLITYYKVIAYEEKKQALQEEVREMEATLEELKECRRDTPRHVQFADLPPEDRFKQLGMKSKYFLDTIKMIAYRAETAMADILRRSMHHQDEARSLLCSLYANGSRSPA